MITIENIQLSFPSKVLFESGNMTISYGQITGIIGESGTGKTVLLQEIGLLRKECHFDYKFDGKSINDLNDQQRALVRSQNISFIYQDVCFFQNMNLKENIEFFAMLAGKIVSMEDIHHLLDMVHLDFDLSTSIDILSGGEKQRLAILCGLIRDADLFIFDEPTAYLDAQNTAIIIELLQDLAYQKNKMVLVSTHDARLINIFDNIYEIHSLKLEARIKKEETNQENTHSHVLLSNKIIKKYVYLTHLRYKAGFFSLSIVAGLICTLLALIFTYSQNYQSIMGAPLLDIMHHEVSIVKKDGQMIYPSSQAKLKDQLINYDLYNNYQITALINDTPVYIKAYYPHEVDTLPVMEKGNTKAVFNEQPVEDIYLSYGFYHTILKDCHTFNLLCFQNQILKLTPTKVLDPHYTSSFDIYIPYDTFMSYLYLMKVDLSQAGVQSITVHIKDLNDISYIQKKLSKEYEILNQNNLMFHIESAKLFDSSYIVFIVMIVLIAFIIYKIYSLIQEQQNIALLSSLGLTTSKLIQMITYKEGIFLLISCIITCIMSAISLYILGLFSLYTWVSMIIASSGCLVFIMLIMIFSFSIMIKIFPPYKLLK